MIRIGVSGLMFLLVSAHLGSAVCFMHIKCTFSALLLVGHQERHPACKNWVVGCWHGYLSGAKWCRFACGPADPIVTHCLLLQEIQIGFVFGRPYYQSSLWYTVSSVCNVLYCGETVRPSEKVSEGLNRKPGSKSSFLRSPPYFYFQFRRYGHQDGRFCLIFASIAQQLVLDGTNGVSSSKPCAYCRIVRPFKWTVNAYSFALRVVKAYVRNCSNVRPYDCIW